jgi:hypothetical protein
MIQKGKAPPSCSIAVTHSAEKQIIQTGLTIIIPNMTRMRFRTTIFLPGEVETEVFSALLAEFKKMPVQDHPTDLTVMDLSTHLSQVVMGSRVQGFVFFHLPP